MTSWRLSGSSGADDIDGTVGIAGLGGLGSNIACMLARSGVGRIVTADFDTVDASNLNRQIYWPSQVGMKKTEACRRILEIVSPGTEVLAYDIVLDADNIPLVFEGCDVICEALDSPEAKSMLVDAVLTRMDGVPVVAGSGMSGMDSPNSIRTVRRFDRLFVCGDGTSDGGDMHAPRVMVCAGHQANAALRLLRGMEG